MMKANIREIKTGDVDAVTKLIVRLKKFNSEHDPLFDLSDKVEDHVREYVNNAIEKETRDIIVAEAGGKIVGLVAGDILDRSFYKPEKELRITELYILPEYRKTGLGRKLIETLIQREKKKGCEVLTVEFPTENLVATKFYAGQGMRSVISVYGKKIT